MASKMIIDRDVSIKTDDGLVLRADVYRPEGGTHPVLMTYGPYGKGIPWREAYKIQWKFMTTKHPDMLPGSSREYMAWETPDPEIWVPWGYACVRVDSRGCGRSPGKIEIFSPRETRDFYECIEWAATQPWCTGKVGLTGISYFAANQWMVAGLQPPHLTAMIPWEGFADNYRDANRHGGIESNAFIETWFPKQLLSVQHGNPATIMDPWLGERASGPATLNEEELTQNRSDPVQDVLERPLDSEWYRSRSADWSKVNIPFLSCANWAGHGLHPRGNFEAFTQAASKQKWLSCHPGRHEEWYYLDEGMELQKRFLDHFLKGVNNGWDRDPPIIMRERRPFSEKFPVRRESAWPLPKTKWTKIYFSAEEDSSSSPTLTWEESPNPSKLSFGALVRLVTFLSAPLEQDTEITGPMAAKIFASSTTKDMDLFVTFQAFSSDGREVDFEGTVDPHTPLSQGWLRASHRKLDASKSLPHRPYHAHDEIQPLEPGKTYELDVEVLPTHIILPKGFRLALQVGGKDFERPEQPGASSGAWMSRGSGPFLHTHPLDRPKDVFAGTTTIFTGGKTSSFLLLPIIDG